MAKIKVLCGGISPESEVSKVNKTLQPYARITRVTILENPLEMTTTKKIKRNYKK